MKIRNEKLSKAYSGSYYTITGVGGDANEWKDRYAGILRERGIGEIKEWIEFAGHEMNAEFSEYYRDAKDFFPEDLHFLAFPLDGLNVGKLAILKLQMQDRWFDDIADNLTR